MRPRNSHALLPRAAACAAGAAGVAGRAAALVNPRHGRRLLPLAAALAGALVLSACAGHRRGGTPDNEPTLKTLASRHVEVSPDQKIEGGEDKTIAAYHDFLAVAPAAPQRAEAMRRLGDLEMDSADNRLASDQGGLTASGAPDYREAIARYQDFLKAYPQAEDKDRILYQLARAQEQGGELEAALKTLDRLVAEHPSTAYRDEAQFRRGELLFTTRDYARAEQAYATVLVGAPDGPYRERALYMQGWSMFKQGRLEEGLKSFFGVLDLELAERDDDEAGEDLSGLSRAARELVEDSFRVVSISLANLQGAASIPAYIDGQPQRASYEHRVYAQLGELYIKQDRVKDAADTFGLFVARRPLHAQAPVLQARVIELYEKNGFATLALDAKKDYVSRYGAESDFRRANPEGWAHAQPLVKTHLSELARHYHAAAQKSKASGDYQEAVRWYRAYLGAFPADEDAAQNNFLLAELLYEDKRHAEAAAEYEKTAYGYPAHAHAADAGYAALLCYAALQKQAAPTELPALQREGVESALRFADAFGGDARAGGVLTDAADKLFALKDGERAVQVARRVLALQPPAAPEQRRVAWTVVAHAAFEQGGFAEAEKAYGEVLALTPDKAADRAGLVERLAASVYKQGEQAREAGRDREAVEHFTRVAVVAPASPVRATAQYDAAAALIGLKDWDGAARTLEDFRSRYPNHPLEKEVAAKLATAYVESGRASQAAVEFERIAASQQDGKLARAALWQAAELHAKAADAKGGDARAADGGRDARVPDGKGGGEVRAADAKSGDTKRGDAKPAVGKAGDGATERAAAAKVYERYVKLYPEPLEPAVEARWRLAALAKAQGDRPRELAWMKDVLQADQRGADARTDRTRTLGASAALALAEPAFEDYRKVGLVEPLARQLKLKKAKFEEVLRAYAVAADYGVAEVTTAATFHTAALYQDFGRAMLASERPKKLSKAEREQYDVLLEEQAFPFEEKAIALHEANARRAGEGLYDEWVRRSFGALAVLRPVRYGKAERGEEVIDAIR